MKSVVNNYSIKGKITFIHLLISFSLISFYLYIPPYVLIPKFICIVLTSCAIFRLTYPVAYLTLPLKCLMGISHLTYLKLNSKLSPLQNLLLYHLPCLSKWQVCLHSCPSPRLWHRSWFLSFSLILFPLHQQIRSALPPKHLQNLVTSDYPHCSHSSPGHQNL